MLLNSLMELSRSQADTVTRSSQDTKVVGVGTSDCLPNSPRRSASSLLAACQLMCGAKRQSEPKPHFERSTNLALSLSWLVRKVLSVPHD